MRDICFGVREENFRYVSVIIKILSEMYNPV